MPTPPRSRGLSAFSVPAYVAGLSVAERIEVIGHFASESAAAVVESYAQAGIPLILPASTCAALTEDGRTTFRVCASDRVLAGRLLKFAETQGFKRLALFADPSLHGQQQLRELPWTGW